MHTVYCKAAYNKAGALQSRINLGPTQLKVHTFSTRIGLTVVTLTAHLFAINPVLVFHKV